MSAVIIGIHGLGNKPPRAILEKWWREAIQEGFGRIGESKTSFKFEMVYWADVLHSTPLQMQANGGDGSHVLQEPYFPIPYTKHPEASKLRRRILDYIEKQIDRLYLRDDLTIDLSKISDRIIHRFFQDLEVYYSQTVTWEDNEERLVRDIIRNRLHQVLRKYKNHDILLLAHSMGSIISYDVLTGQARDIDIDTFITIGSPLGIPVIMDKIALEGQFDIKNGKKPATPDNIISHWYNFSDLHDRVAFNYNLADDYQAGSRNVLPVDTIVFNDYEIEKQRNPHKSYGYLRSPELSKVVFDFLARKESPLSLWLRKKAASLACFFDHVAKIGKQSG